MTWKKVSEEKPRVGQLVVIRKQSPIYLDDGTEDFYWEYDAGILRASSYGSAFYYIEVAHGEYHVRLDEDTEWQEIEE